MNIRPTLLAALLLAPLAALHAAPSADARIVIASEAGAKLDSDVTKGGGTDDTVLIQSILALNYRSLQRIHFLFFTSIIPSAL
jgi:hypothetical protein